MRQGVTGHLLISASAFSIFCARMSDQHKPILPHARRELEIVKRLARSNFIIWTPIHSFVMSNVRQLDHHEQYYIKSGDLYIIVCCLSNLSRFPPISLTLQYFCFFRSATRYSGSIHIFFRGNRRDSVI